MTSIGAPVTFHKRMGKSWSVYSPIRFKNERGLHVETHMDDLEGKTFYLGKRSIKEIGKNVAVMYDVPGVRNGRFVAHLTAYFGPPKESKKY